MIIRVIVKHSESADWEAAQEIYTCDTSSPNADTDPLEASSIVNAESPNPFDIGVWHAWSTFREHILNVELPSTAEGPVDISIRSFPERNAVSPSITTKQAHAALVFLRAIVEFIPRLRADLSGVWVRVD